MAFQNLRNRSKYIMLVKIPSMNKPFMASLMEDSRKARGVSPESTACKHIRGRTEMSAITIKEIQKPMIVIGFTVFRKDEEALIGKSI